MTTESAGAGEERVRIGQNLRRIRKGLGWSQERMAHEMREAGAEGWTQSTVSRVENGGQEIRFMEAMVLNSLVGRGVWEGTSWMEKSRGFAGLRTNQAVQRAAERALVRAEDALQDALHALSIARWLQDPAAMHPDDAEEMSSNLAGIEVRPEGLDWRPDWQSYHSELARQMAEDE